MAEAAIRTLQTEALPSGGIDDDREATNPPKRFLPNRQARKRFPFPLVFLLTKRLAMAAPPRPKRFGSAGLFGLSEGSTSYRKATYWRGVFYPELVPNEALWTDSGPRGEALPVGRAAKEGLPDLPAVGYEALRLVMPRVKRFAGEKTEKHFGRAQVKEALPSVCFPPNEERSAEPLLAPRSKRSP